MNLTRRTDIGKQLKKIKNKINNKENVNITHKNCREKYWT